MSNIKEIVQSYSDFFKDESEFTISLSKHLQKLELDPKSITFDAVIITPDQEHILMVLDTYRNRFVLPQTKLEVTSSNLFDNWLEQLKHQTRSSDIILHPWHSFNQDMPLDILISHKKGNKNVDQSLNLRYVFLADKSEYMAFDPRELEGIQWLSQEELALDNELESTLHKLYLLQK